MNHLGAVFTLAGLGVLAWQVHPAVFGGYLLLVVLAARLKG